MIAFPVFVPRTTPRLSGYSGPPPTMWDVVVVLAALVIVGIVFTWLTLTVAAWLLPMGKPPTLTKVLRSQWRWLRVLATTGRVPK